MANLFIDSKFVGTVKDPVDFVKQVIDERRIGKISLQVNLNYDRATNSVFVNTSKSISSSSTGFVPIYPPA